MKVMKITHPVIAPLDTPLFFEERGKVREVDLG